MTDLKVGDRVRATKKMFYPGYRVGPYGGSFIVQPGDEGWVTELGVGLHHVRWFNDNWPGRYCAVNPGSIEVAVRKPQVEGVL